MASPMICSGCGGTITDLCLDMFKMHWHPSCLCCNTCGKDFSDGSTAHEGSDGYAYCSKDFQDAFGTKCASCGQVIVGELLNAIEKQFHPNCFVCGTCKVQLSGQFFIAPNGNPYCEKHYYEVIGMLCADCDRPIISGKCISFLEKKYHPEHFRCSFCKKNLVGQQYMKQNLKPYCKNCHISLYG